MSLSLRELLAVLLGAGPAGKGCLGLAGDVLARAGSELPETEQERAFFTAMADGEYLASPPLMDLRGLGPAGRARLLASFELARRYARFADASRRAAARRPPRQRLPALEAKVVRRIAPELRHAANEWLAFVPLYAGGALGALCVVARGGRAAVAIEPSTLAARILRLQPLAVLLVHNHPSGDPAPSAADMALTDRVAVLLAPFGVALLSHLVVTANEVRRLQPLGPVFCRDADPP